MNQCGSFICLVVLFVSCHADGASSLSANIDGQCEGNADCSVTNSECVKTFKNCNKGECKCSTGYHPSSATSCLLKVSNTQACDNTKYCTGDTTCDAGTNTCKCASGKTYNTKLAMCVVTGLKAISEECTTATDCYQDSTGMSECVAASGTSTPKYCRCKSGYITENYQCRKPHVKETCTAGVGCQWQIALSSVLTMPDQVAETCSSSTNKCACPSGSTILTVDVLGVTYDVCQTTFTGTMLDNGATCTSSKQCTSHICASCPGASTMTCVITSGSSNGVSAQVSACLSVLLTLSLGVIAM